MIVQPLHSTLIWRGMAYTPPITPVSILVYIGRRRISRVEDHAPRLFEDMACKGVQRAAPPVLAKTLHAALSRAGSPLSLTFVVEPAQMIWLARLVIEYPLELLVCALGIP